MKPMIILLLLLQVLTVPVSAAAYTAPEVPDAGNQLMPENTDSFSNIVAELLKKAVEGIHPDLKDAASVSRSVFAAVLLISVLCVLVGTGRLAVNLAGTAALTAILLQGTNSMLQLAKSTVQEMSDYGKLLLPVMTGALAAQGGVTASAALYIGTAFFDALLGTLLTELFIPMVYLFLAFSVAGSATGEDLLKRLRDLIKSTVSWSLKTILTVFTTYMSITGVVSGTTDAAALKATKVTISTVVPMVGGILSDASEAVLVGAGVMKNAAGLYGIAAVLALCLGPFLKIGVHYLMLKVTVALCSIFAGKGLCTLAEDFSSAMGMMLAITGSMCLLLLISTVCFLKGVGV